MKPEPESEVNKINPSELEPLYWVLEDSLDGNDLPRAAAIYDLFCTIAQKRKQLLIQGLKPKQIDRLKNISYELYDREIYCTKRAVEIKFPIQPKPLGFKTEKELENHLAANLVVLEAAIGQELKLVGTQVKTDFEYACDLVVESSTTFYPIELKLWQSTHSVVSQIEKYCHYFYRKLRYDRYKPIQGIVVANGADAYSINEVRKSGHWLFDIQNQNGSIILVKI